MINTSIIISVIIVNWNGKRWLSDCLNSLYLQDFKDFEIILVDNASTDSSVQFLEENFKEVVVIQNNLNDGFARGNNIGLPYAKGDFLLFLNNDTIVSSKLLTNLLAAFKANPKLGTAQAKLVLIDDPDRLDACGAYFTFTTVSYHFGVGKNQSLPIYNKPFPVFTNKGACMMVRRNIIEKVGLFDEDFWCYYEETDLCQRIWMAGWECWYWPDALCHHSVGGTSKTMENSYIHFHNFKNKLASHLKNFSVKSLFWVLPMHFIVCFGFSFFFVLTGRFANAYAFLRGTYWVFSNFRSILDKRRQIQSLRQKSDLEIFKSTMKNPRLSYYYYFLTNLGKYND